MFGITKWNMEKRRHKYNQGMKEAYKQKPFIKPPRISFWDNIFYWSWLLLVMVFDQTWPAAPYLCDCYCYTVCLCRAVHCCHTQLSWQSDCMASVYSPQVKGYIGLYPCSICHIDSGKRTDLQGKPLWKVEGGVWPDGNFRKEEAQNHILDFYRYHPACRICSIQAVLPFQHAVPAALTLTKTDYQMKTTRIMNKISFIWVPYCCCVVAAV